MVLTIILGPMFAGKTTKLIELAQNTTHNSLVIKPSYDTRYTNDNIIVTHDNFSIHAFSLHSFQNAETIIPKNKDLFIDEAHLFENDDVFEFIYNRMHHQNIVISTINGTDKQQPNTIVSQLLPYSSQIYHLLAKCDYCNADANFSVKHNKASSSTIIGGKEMYYASCFDCLKKFKEKKTIDKTNINKTFKGRLRLK